VKAAAIAAAAAAAALALGACTSRTSQPPPPSTSSAAAPSAPGEVRWLKGQLHTHSNRSGDSQTPPTDVIRWYEERGFDFVVFTDHETITDVTHTGRLLPLAGVELTQNLRDCGPAPDPGYACLLHMNALVVETPAPPSIPWPPATSPARLDLYDRALDVTNDLGGVAQLNHPNMHWAADVETIVALARRGLLIVEIANMSVDSMREGDETHPDAFALWDAVLSRGVTVWATCTDDAHHYDDAEAARAAGGPVYTGSRGWVMVHASRDAASIRDALRRGDFYGSSGVTLAAMDRTTDSLTIEAAPATRDPRIRFIGRGGAILAEQQGHRATFDLRVARGSYVRAEVHDAGGRFAFTQPVFVAADAPPAPPPPVP
jgi:hypothetical protein